MSVSEASSSVAVLVTKYGKENNMTSKQRAKKIERAIRLTWDSLESHLDYCYSNSLSEDKVSEEGDYQFHKAAARDYAEVILILTTLY